jgi:hypothetical protein
MSMVGYILRVTPEQARQLNAQPKIIPDILSKSAGHDDSTGNTPSKFGKIAAALDLQQSWHVLHYLLCGEAYQGEAPADTLLSGDEIGPDMGYGPARYVTPDETLAFSEFLLPLDYDTLTSKIDLNRMRSLHVYLVSKTSEQDRAFLIEYVRPHFISLKDYIARAAADGGGYFFWIW